jgi:putative adhesin
MRKSAAVLGVLAALALSTCLASAEVTKSLRFEMTPPAGLYAVENLAGTMKVVPGASSTVVAVATVHAESDELLGSIRLVQVRGKKGEPVLRVEYPLDRHTTYRYPRNGSGVLSSLFGGGSNTTVEYAGKKVKVTSDKGVLLWADVEVQIPEDHEGAFRNSVGALRGQGVEGKLSFDGASADVSLETVRGTIKVDTGSGDVKAHDVEGELACNTGSGDISLQKFRGDLLDFDTGSGDIDVRDSQVRTVKADTGSGDIRVHATGLDAFDGDTGSGDISLDAADGALTTVRADTGSGDVTLILGPQASFELTADQGSGGLVSHYEDAKPILSGRELVGYRRGDAKAKIHVETGSGDVVLQPGG